jgi:uncharacterized repeat protein (TIGR02543 family)
MYPSQGTSVELPKAVDYHRVKAGYTHMGWNDGASTTALAAAGDTPYTPARDTTLTAAWTAETYTVAYNLVPGGTANPNPISYTIDDLPITLQKINITGRIFAGWYSDSSFGNDKLVTSIPAGVTGRKDLYAKWAAPSAALSQSPVTVTAIAAAGTGGGLAANASLVINLTDTKVGTAISGDASSWFGGNTVNGLTYTAAAPANADSIKITVAGTPTVVSSASGVTITIPSGVLADPNGAAVTWDIAVTGTVNYDISQIKYSDNPALASQGAYYVSYYGAGLRNGTWSKGEPRRSKGVSRRSRGEGRWRGG